VGMAHGPCEKKDVRRNELFVSRFAEAPALSAMQITLRPLALASLLALSLGAGCNAKLATVLPDPSGNDEGLGSGADGGAGLPGDDRPLVPASKVDLLLVVDSSPAMREKSSRLASSIGTLLRDVARGNDVHVGVLSSALGNMGGDLCLADHWATSGRAHLRMSDESGAFVPEAATGVLSYTGGDLDAFVGVTEALVRGVGERGCGFEAQLETMYRFLVQPDPWERVTRDANQQATFGNGIDATLLQQRAAFLRPDSALVVVLITDADDSSLDPLTLDGQGWGFMSKNFPFSQVPRHGVNPGKTAPFGTTAPRGTSVCASNPASPDCTSCFIGRSCNPADPVCQKIKADPNCSLAGDGGYGEGFDGYLSPHEDVINVRFHRMKQRFGVDPQFPIARYIDGLSRSRVPNRESEHVTKVLANGRREISGYTGTPTCTNPIFAAALPSKAGDEICTLPRGPRSRELVLFTVLGGLPPALATDSPDWTKLLGQDPDSYDESGIDPHMIPLSRPRPGLPKPEENVADPVHGFEWHTLDMDLEYACTFPLETPTMCNAGEGCDCDPEVKLWPPLCGAPGGERVRGRAYPTPRPLRVARALGERGIVGSVCSESYEPTMTRLSQRLASRLAF
jgi:hypothetical protein